MVSFDVLIKAPQAQGTPSLSSIDDYRPREVDVQKVRSWLLSQGVACHDIGFGLACEAKAQTMERVFGIILEGIDFRGEPKWPNDIAPLIDQLTLTRAPQLY